MRSKIVTNGHQDEQHVKICARSCEQFSELVEIGENSTAFDSHDKIMSDHFILANTRLGFNDCL